MNARIDVSTEKGNAFCKRHRIHRLALFGPVLRDDFRPGSDVDVLDAARSIRRFTANVALDEYLRNEMMQLAVERQLKVIGEAARVRKF